MNMVNTGNMPTSLKRRSGHSSKPGASGDLAVLFDKTDGGDRMLDEFLSGLAERFFDGKRKPESLRFYEVAPLNAACRAKIGDGQTVSSDMVRYGICVACCVL